MAKEMNFENGMDELEALVETLEKGELNLEDSFKAYEKAVKLASRLKSILDQGEARIAMLTENLTRQDIADEVISHDD
ncbi:MAG: exodeoxyribonuclease VII small subunit [Clostridia bacterium]|nr:exodeoxyribonuclease VII small subunit [Clostridia bacterium]